ncbi:uncharacterized protein LOC109823315 [Asparagus officinalis]|uniref:uncharacterized protein LOC109823315 n=1 Tax=Asparagus officinalis TaxID=4686 RepID=UPI00098E76BD|nr:uncharacterized protein LOC109823315 [Asparagus officinalis]
MEQDPNMMHQALNKDTDQNSDASSSTSSFGVSSSRFSDGGSFNNRVSISLSRGGSNMNVSDEGTSHRSLGRRASRGSYRSSSSLSRDVGDRILNSITLSHEFAEEILGEVDSSLIAQVGDSGDRVTSEDRNDGSRRFSVDDRRSVENGFLSGSHILDSVMTISPVAEEKSPLPTDAILMQKVRVPSFKDYEYKLPQRLDYIFYLIHYFGYSMPDSLNFSRNFCQVLTRYLLQKLFGPSLLALTGSNTPLYLDLPSNMLGSFLMGWFGVVFKPEIRHISEHLAIGLSTGYLGSVTTFSGWNQKMLDLASKGHWAFAVGGIIFGMMIVNESIKIGVESAEGLHKRLNQSSVTTGCSLDLWRINNRKRHITVMTLILLLLGSLWGLSGALAGKKLDNATDGAVLWLGCLVGPPGVWARWYLARLNGQGFGKKGWLKWLPTGTLTANILAASLMAALSTISKAVDTKRCTILVSGVQLGFLGCMSTVSTFVAEVYAMRESGHSGRAVAYTMATILPSFAIGTLIYSVPVWTKHYS